MDTVAIASLFDIKDFPFKAIFDNCTYPWEVLPKLSEFVLNFEGLTEISDRVFVGVDVEIEDGAKIIGPVIIGSHSKIGHAAYIRPTTIIGENVTIGHASEIKNSVILNNTSVAHLNYIGDSILGNNVNIAGGVIAANWRFDKKNVTVKLGNQKIETGLEKCGAAIGDNANIGVNAVLNPGTVLSKNTVVFPLTLVTGFHEDGKVVR